MTPAVHFSDQSESDWRTEGALPSKLCSQSECHHQPPNIDRVIHHKDYCHCQLLQGTCLQTSGANVHVWFELTFALQFLCNKQLQDWFSNNKTQHNNNIINTPWLYTRVRCWFRTTTACCTNELKKFRLYSGKPWMKYKCWIVVLTNEYWSCWNLQFVYE